VAGVFFLSALGFFGSRLLLFCPFAIAVLPCSRKLAPARTVGRARPPGQSKLRRWKAGGASEINIRGTGLIMVLTLMYFPNGIVGTLAHKNKLPRFLNWD
jgi:ABC-type branched-subunit amino acid transport system permease subunit